MSKVDARKSPWFLDLGWREMEAVIAAVPKMVRIAQAAEALRGSVAMFPAGEWIGRALADLEAAHPEWRTWIPEDPATYIHAVCHPCKQLCYALPGAWTTAGYIWLREHRGHSEEAWRIPSAPITLAGVEEYQRRGYTAIVMTWGPAEVAR